MITRNDDASALRVFLLRENFTDNHGVTYLSASIGENVLIPNDAEGVSTFSSLLFWNLGALAYPLA